MCVCIYIHTCLLKNFFSLQSFAILQADTPQFPLLPTNKHLLYFCIFPNICIHTQVSSNTY